MSNHNQRAGEVQWQDEAFGKQEVEPQKYARMDRQEDGKFRFTSGINRWIASDLVVKAYR